MTDIARLALDTDTSGLARGERGLDSIASRASKTARDIGKSMQGLGTKLSIGVTAPLAFFGKQAIQSSIDAQEMESAFDVVFGNMASSVREWAEETGDAMGRSTQEIQRGALAFEELFSKALDPAQSSELSKTFAVLTQDLASFKNLSNDVAQQKLFSGLTGEAEPLRAVGVFINDAAVQAKALELGLEQVNGKFTDQDKIVARAALIQEQLAQASGDVLRTGDSAANQIKASQAAYEELSIVIGTKLLPALTPIITAVGGILTSFSELGDSTQNIIIVAALGAAALGPIITVLGTLLTIAPAVATGIGLIKTAMIALLANPILLAAAAIITGIVLAWQNWDKIKEIISNVGDAISAWWTQNIQPTFDFVMRGIDIVVDYFDSVFGDGIRATVSVITQIFDGDFRGAWDRIGPIIKGAVKAGLVAFVELHIGAARQIASLAADMIGFGKDIINGLIAGIKAAPQAVWNALKSVVGFGVDNVKSFLGINSPSKLFMGYGENVTEGFVIGIEDGTPAVKRATDALVEAANSSIDKLKTNIFEPIVTVQQSSIEDLGLNDAIEVVGNNVAPAFRDKVANPLLENIERISTGFADMVVDVEGSIRGLVSSFRDGDIVGVIVGVADTISSIVGAISGSGGGFSLPRFARGTSFAGGGLSMVGEEGPELVNLPRGSQVFSTDKTKRMMNGGGDAQATQQVVIINNSALADAYVDGRSRNIAEPIGIAAAQAGSQGAQQQMARRRRKAL